MQVETYLSKFHIPASWQTGYVKNKQLLELEGNLSQVDSFAINCYCRYQDRIKFLIKKFKNLNFPMGNNLTSYWGITNRTPWVNKKYNGVVAKLLPYWDFNQEVFWLIPLPTSTLSTQRISIPVLYGGLPSNIIFFTLFGVNNALKWVTRLECYYTLLDSGAMVSWSWRA